jgi:hypothetical protein
MGKLFIVSLVVVVLLLSPVLFTYAQEAKPPVELPFVVYKEQGPGNHYIPSGRMGDTSDIRMTYASFDNPYEGETSIKVIYSANMLQGAGWAGIFWQNPANNWATEPDAGYNLTGATRLTLWARGEKGGEIVEFKMGGIIGEYGDSDSASTGPVQLTTDWTQYSIDLSGLDLSYIIGGFCFSISAVENSDGAVFYLDDIVYEK